MESTINLIFSILGGCLVSFVVISIIGATLEMGKEKQKEGKQNPYLIWLVLITGTIVGFNAYRNDIQRNTNKEKMRNAIISEIETYSEEITDEIGAYTDETTEDLIEKIDIPSHTQYLEDNISDIIYNEN